MTDKTAGVRVRKQREARTAEGWQLVSVWVPTELDAHEIRQLAADRRALAENVHDLSKEVKAVSIETQTRIARAIADHGSAAYNTPSGAVLDLMTKLADEDDLEGFSRAVVILARAKPSSAHRVISAVPSKITNFMMRHRNVTVGEFRRWEKSNTDWAERLEAAVRRPEVFARTVESMIAEIKHLAN